MSIFPVVYLATGRMEQTQVLHNLMCNPHNLFCTLDCSHAEMQFRNSHLDFSMWLQPYWASRAYRWWRIPNVFFQFVH